MAATAPGKTVRRRSPEFDFASEQRPELGRRLLAVMNHPYPAGYQPAIGQLAAQAKEGHQPEFDVMAVRPPLDAGVLKRDREFLVLAKL
jgi:hypothetical protein